MVERGTATDGLGHASLGEAVRSCRVARGMSLEALAVRAGCSKSYLSLIENGKVGPPGEEVLRRVESALELEGRAFERLASLGSTPAAIRRELAELQSERRDARRAVEAIRGLAEGGSLDEAYRSGRLRELIERFAPEAEGPEPVSLPVEVPVINRVAAGYPREFTDLGYPARVADEYVRCPDLRDPDAFAARVVGDSMLPEYREGDVVVFSPLRDVRSGSDCFARLAPDDETTFKRVYLERDEGGRELIRLQPLNPAYPARVLDREGVVGLYAAVSVMRQIV